MSSSGDDGGGRDPERVADPVLAASSAGGAGPEVAPDSTDGPHPARHQGPEFCVPASYPGQLGVGPAACPADAATGMSGVFPGWRTPPPSTEANLSPTGGHEAEDRSQGRGWSALAIAAFAAGCVPWIGVLAAVPLGVVALATIARSGERGKGLAIAGMAIPILIWVVSVAVVVAVLDDVARRDRTGTIAASGRLYFADIRVGDCVQIDGLAPSGDVGPFDLKGMPCSQAHNAQSVGGVAIADAVYPGHAYLTRRAQQTCTQLVDQYVDPLQVGGLMPYLFIPTKELWDSDLGARRVVCFVTNQNFSSLGDTVVR